MGGRGGGCIWKENLTLKGLKYVDYYGDDDSKSHATMKDIYGKNSAQNSVGCES